MSKITHSILSMPEGTASIIVLLMFVAVFIVTLIWAYRKESTAIYRYSSNIPLEEDNFYE